MADPTVLLPAMVALTDTLVGDFDLHDLLHLLTEKCVEAFHVSAAGVMLAGPGKRLQVVASSSEAMRSLELFELQMHEGPCLESFRSGEPVQSQLLATATRWPRFAPAAAAAGFRSVLALPMRLRDQVVGALNLFSVEETPTSEDDLLAVEAMAAVATIALLQHRAVVDAQLLAAQLQAALNSRVVIEQAKGVLAERASVEVDVAFLLMRSYARKGGHRLLDVAQGVVAGELKIPVPPQGWP